LYSCGKAAVLHPGKTLQTHACVLPRLNAPQRVGWKEICNNAKIACRHDGTKLLSFPHNGTDPKTSHFAESPVHGSPDASSADFSLKPLYFRSRRCSLALKLNPLGLELLDMCLTLAVLG